MSPREFYPSLQKGREMLQKQEAEQWEKRIAQGKAWCAWFSDWLDGRLIFWTPGSLRSTEKREPLAL